MNKNFWNLYKEAKGKDVIELFNPDVEDTYESVINICESAKKWNDDFDSVLTTNIYGCILINLLERYPLPKENFTRKSFLKFVEDFDLINFDVDINGDTVWYEKEILLPKDKFRNKNSMVCPLSLFLYFHYDYFKPILLPQRFDLMQKRCDVLGIDLPEIPRTKDYKEYLMFYYDLCGCMNEFQKKYELTDAEFCACLYDFGGMAIGETVKIEMPKPTNVWLTGASGKADFTYLDNLGKDEDNQGHIWACNERTKRGDIIIIYCTSPRSYIHSIWRANSGGIFNPFDSYQCRTAVCDGIRIPEIGFKDLKADKYFSQVPIVRGNLQGINGVELSADDYSRLLEMIEERGGNVSILPKLFDGADVDFGIIELEKDVEEKILIPILRELGYEDKDWTRQLSLKAGRQEKAIPDFVFFPQGKEHFENAPFVIEAKLDMSSAIELNRAFRQGLSYARLLRSKLMGLCDKERLVIYQVDEVGSSDQTNPIFENHWKAIYSDSAIGTRLKQLIGAEVIRSL
ncbi:restriction endonuclease subunit R [Prevotella sp. HUN102]|uniref:restriction endonuclease subunit R n=1 Tax=Prevotella sp. HUN102 TaxID=1392486 RepID=UPI00048A4BED|nr:restriction endonuclease subunit R [Prevotella sp. HUN102]